MSSVVLPVVGEETAGTVAKLDASAFGQCLNGTAAVLATLDLPRIFWDRVHVRWNSYIRVDGKGQTLDKLPCIIVSPVPTLRPASERGSNQATAVHFLVSIAIHRAGGGDGINQMGDCLAALQEIYVAFSKKPNRDLFAVHRDMLLSCTVDNAEADNERARLAGYLVQFLRVDYLLRLPYVGAA